MGNNNGNAQMDGLVERIVQVVIERLNPSVGHDELTSETPLIGRGLGLDSMAALELVTGLEEALGIELDESELSRETLSTIGSLADHIRPLLS